MKLNYLKFFLFYAIAAIFVNNAVAKAIDLHEQPKADSKVMGTLDTASGMIPIYSPKDGGGWVKVADPRNGNVGWIKSSDFGENGFSFNVITGGEGGNRYQIIQYGNGQPYNATQMSDAMKKLQNQEQTIQRDMQKMMQDMFNNMHQSTISFPTVMPVVVMPSANPPTETTKTATQPKTQSAKPAN